MSLLQSAMAFFRSTGIVGVPLVLILLVVLAQVGRVVHARLRPGEPDVEASHGAILVAGVVGACVGLLGTLIGVWVSAGAITSAGEVSTALAWSMIRLALTPSIIGFSILAVASIAWIVLHYWGGRGLGAVILVTAVLAGTSCTRDRGSVPGTAVRRDSAGVVIVENRGGPRAFTGRVERLADLTTPDEALVALPWGIAADRLAERVYVADGAGRRVVAFDAEGRFVGELGRAGEGPGEFGMPWALAVQGCGGDSCHEVADAGGMLVVLDSRRFVLSRWSSEGRFLGEERVPLNYWGPGFAIGADWFATVTESTAGMRVEQRLQIRMGQENHAVHEVARELTMMGLPCATMPAPRIFAPDVVWTRHEDTFYYLNGLDYRIDAYAGGTAVRSIRRAVPPIEVSHAMAIAGVQLGPGPYQGLMRQCGVSPEELVDAAGHEDRLAPVAWLAVDPGGRLWVAGRTSGPAPESLDVLDVDGEYLGTLDVPVLPIAFLSASRFVGVRLELSTGRLQPSIYEVRDDGTTAVGTDPGAERVREFRDCPACPAMIELPPGRYLMGRPDGEDEQPGLVGNPDWLPFSRNAERPQVQVEIGYPVAMGKYEVTFDEWDHCVDAGGCTYRPTDRGFGRGSRPVIHVSRLDTEEYLAWLRDVTGEPHRLPSSAEWEYAARAGTITARWWGDALGNGRAVCDGCGSSWDNRSTAPVGSFPANPWGLHDMLSNVSEVVADCWHDTYQGHPTDGSPRLEAPPGWPDGECRRATWRGGSWPYFVWTVRSATRSGGNMTPEHRSDHPRAGGGHGFRVARTVVASEGGA